MKKIFSPMLIVLVFLLSTIFTACNNEELFIEPVNEVVDSDPKEDETPEDTDDPVTIVDTSLPCEFTLDSVESNSTIIIDCVLDLEGVTVNLPSNVAIVYQGGKIINGVINFSEGSVIDGEILNSTITLGGALPQLKDPIFHFTPSKWGIVEGEVSDEVALENKNILQETINAVKSFGASTFEVSKMDAYFLIADGWASSAGYARNGISLPSDFHLKMNSETFLRVQPNKWPFYYLLAVHTKENVKISGGNLVGDRYTHDYSPILDSDGIARDQHGWGTLLWIGGSNSIIAEGINILDATGDGVWFGAVGHRIYPDTPYNQNITLRECTVDGSRRNNISVTDGEDIYIKDCIIKNSGGGENLRDANGDVIYSSAGTAPEFGIDVEPVIATYDNGEDKFWEKCENVVISGCEFINNEKGSIIDYSGRNVIIDNNVSDKGFYADNSTGTQFTNNKFYSDEIKFHAAITTGSWLKKVYGVETEFSDNNLVKGNTISGFNVGVVVRGKNTIVSDNSIERFGDAIRVLESENCYIYNNDIRNGEFVNSVGVKIRNEEVRELLFENNFIEVPRVPFALSNVNSESNIDYNLKFTNSTFKALNSGYSIEISNSDNVEISNSIITNCTINLEDSNGFIESGNTYN